MAFFAYIYIMILSYVKHFNLTQSDRNTVKQKCYISLVGQIKNPEEQKLVNTLTNDRVIVENQMTKILDFLKVAKERIGAEIAKINQTYDVENLPETSSAFSLIARPKEAIQMILDGYKMHLKNIDEIEKVLTTESEPDEDDIID